MKPKHQRALIIAIAGIFIAGGLTLILRNLDQHLLYYYTPSELETAKLKPNQIFRLGGMVAEGSVESTGPQSIRFETTDFKANISVTYSGIVPDLFREGQGVVATGRLQKNGEFSASEILAKHDENYMPPSVEKKMGNVDSGTPQ